MPKPYLMALSTSSAVAIPRSTMEMASLKQRVLHPVGEEARDVLLDDDRHLPAFSISAKGFLDDFVRHVLRPDDLHQWDQICRIPEVGAYDPLFMNRFFQRSLLR